MKFYKVSEKDLRQFLIDSMEADMNERDGVDNWSWYGSSYTDTMTDWIPLSNVPDQTVESFEDVADLIIQSGEYEECNGD